MRTTLLVTTFSFILLFSCGQDSGTIDSSSNNDIETDLIESTKDVENISPEKQDEPIGTRIQFSDFSIFIDSVYAEDAEGELSNIQKDTAIVYLEIGGLPIEGATIRINQDIYDKVELFQMHENSIIIMDEGPHCDLTEWEHFYSEWLPLKEMDIAAFKMNKYSEEDYSKFLEIDIQELKKAVKVKCGEKWVEHIKDVKSPFEYPSGVSISRIYLKVMLSSYESKQKVEKIIVFQIPMGC